MLSASVSGGIDACGGAAEELAPQKGQDAGSGAAIAVHWTRVPFFMGLLNCWTARTPSLLGADKQGELNPSQAEADMFDSKASGNLGTCDHEPCCTILEMVHAKERKIG
jgi:hypothetical protein